MTLKMQQTGTGRLAEKGIAITEFCGAPSGQKTRGFKEELATSPSDELLCCACRYPACPPITPFMWSMTRLCSSCGLNRMTSASSPTLTVCPGGQ